MEQEIETPIDGLEAVEDEAADDQLGDGAEVTQNKLCYTLDCRRK